MTSSAHPIHPRRGFLPRTAEVGRLIGREYEEVECTKLGLTKSYNGECGISTEPIRISGYDRIVPRSCCRKVSSAKCDTIETSTKTAEPPQPSASEMTESMSAVARDAVTRLGIRYYRGLQASEISLPRLDQCEGADRRDG